MGFHWHVRIASLAGAVLMLCGCPNPNLYTTPRTLNKGDLQWQLAAEGFGASFDTTVPNANGTGTQTQTTSFATPTLPTFGVRYGVTDGFDMGFRLANLSTLAADGKIRLVKSRVDLAVDPGLQAFFLVYNPPGSSGSSSAGIFYFHLPLLVGVNLSDAFSIVVTPGIVFGVGTATVSSSNNTQSAAGTTGILARAGIGFDWRVTKKLALHPEVTFMKSFQDTNALLYIFGFGFNIGAQPDFSDMAAAAVAPAGPPGNP